MLVFVFYYWLYILFLFLRKHLVNVDAQWIVSEWNNDLRRCFNMKKGGHSLPGPFRALPLARGLQDKECGIYKLLQNETKTIARAYVAKVCVVRYHIYLCCKNWLFCPLVHYLLNFVNVGTASYGRKIFECIWSCLQTWGKWDPNKRLHMSTLCFTVHVFPFLQSQECSL